MQKEKKMKNAKELTGFELRSQLFSTSDLDH